MSRLMSSFRSDAFEHFADPAAILVRMRELLRDDGSVMIRSAARGCIRWWTSFLGLSVGPPIFTEESLIRGVPISKDDGGHSLRRCARRI